MFAIRRITGCVFVSAMALGFVGCDSSSSSKSSGSSGGTSMDALASQVDAQNAAKKQVEATNAAKNAADAAKAAADRQAAEASAAQAAGQEKKAVGSRPQPTTGGYYGAIMGARRHVMNVVDNIAWIQGVRNFQGTYGRNPKDTKEFMNVCVKENDLQLPHIEADEEYLYDPNAESDGHFGQLYVVKKPDAPSEAAASAGSTPPAAPGALK
jgi:hypothetical protein